jgi:putative membrane protein
MERSWLPYCGQAPAPNDWLTRWNLDPLLLIGLALSTLWFVSRARSGADRLRAAVGSITLLLLFVSPFCALTSALFSARVAHHLVLTSLAAPLLAFAWPLARIGGPMAWAAGHALVFWFWHSPQAYGWALSSDATYWAMQATLGLSAMGLWAAIGRAPAPAGVAALLATMVQMGLLGALITFAHRALYAAHLLTTQAWGMSPLDDQQLAGLIMWAPGSALYLGAAMLIGWRLLGPPRATAAT